mgnify:CR=1 FL=1|tara:strand:- start:210 stop:1022 length:813 start_codon:yes stop_codon:yes gene_type:complete
MSKFDYINKSLSDFTENDKPEFRWRQSARMSGELRFKPNKIGKLAEGFTNSTQMIDYRGENQLLINQVGRYIEHKEIDRPKWFEPIIKGTAETAEECIKILNNNCTTSDEIYANRNYIRLLNRLWSIYKLSSLKVRKLTPNIKWKTKLDWDDDTLYNILSNYEDNRELRKNKEDKHILTKIQIDEGDKYPKSYELYKTMIIEMKDIERPKRGNYPQRDPLIQQWKDGQLLGEFTWIQIKEIGYKRSNITGALKGTNGQKTAYKYIWKYKK